MNYKILEGLISKDKWDNKTQISSVESDVITIQTFRKSGHNDCIHREIWRDDYYGEPYLHGGEDRVKEELKLCGFDLDAEDYLVKY